MLLRDPSPSSRDQGEDVVLYKRGTPISHGPIAPPNPNMKSSLTPGSREFVPSSSLLFQLQTESFHIPESKIPGFVEGTKSLPFSLRPLNNDALDSVADSLATLSIQTMTANNNAYSSSLATPQLTHSATTSSPRTSDSDAESPTKYAPPSIPLIRGLTAADLSADLLYSPDDIRNDKPGPGATSPSDDFEMPVMRGGESAFPLPYPPGPNPWSAAQMPYSTAAAPRFPAPAPMPGVAPGYTNLITADMAAAYHASAPAVYPVPYPTYGNPTYAAPPPPAYAPPAPAAAPLSNAGTAWVRDAMQYFQMMGRDTRDTQEGILAAERFLASIHQYNTQFVTYNGGNGPAWGAQQSISPQHGAYMARAALPQLIMYGPADVLRSGIHRLPMPQMIRDFDFGVAPNNRKKDLYKTELCRNWEERGECRYQEKCQFAHGQHELRHTPRHPKYKTEFCRTWYTEGSCPYAGRCCFIHPADTNTAYMAGRMLPGPGSDPLFPRVPASANRGQSLLERIKNTSTDTQSEAYARSQATTSPLNTRDGGSPDVMSNSSASAYGNISLPRVSSAGNLTNITSIVEKGILGGHRLSDASTGSESVVSLARGEDPTRATMTAPTTPTASESSFSSDIPVVPAHFIRPTAPSTSPTIPHSAASALNLRLNTSLSGTMGGPQTAPAARASMSTASMFGPVSPTLQRTNPLIASTPSPRASAFAATANSIRGPSYATLSDLRTPPSARPVTHNRATSHNDSQASTPAPGVTSGALALNIPRAMEPVPPAPMSASANGWMQPVGVAEKRW